MLSTRGGGGAPLPFAFGSFELSFNGSIGATDGVFPLVIGSFEFGTGTGGTIDAVSALCWALEACFPRRRGGGVS